MLLQYQSQIQQTEALQRQREEELRKMGVAVGADREKQLARAKEEPHIVNVHEDPMMSGQVFHFFPLGAYSMFVMRRLLAL